MVLPSLSLHGNPSDEHTRLLLPAAAAESPSSQAEPTKLVGQPVWLSTESYSLLLLLATAVFYSIMSANVHLAVATGGVSAMQLVWLRGVFQGLVIVAALCVYRQPDTTVHDDNDNNKLLLWTPLGPPHARGVVVARGMVGGLGFLLYYYTVSHLPVGDATALLSLHPILTVLAAGVVFGRDEPVRVIHVGAALLSIAGSVCIAQPTFLFGHSNDDNDAHDNKDSSYSTTGYWTALLGASCAATAYILIRRAGTMGGVHTLQLLFSWNVFCLAYSLPFLTRNCWSVPAVAWRYVAGSCVFGSAGHLLMNYAGRHAPAGLGSIVRASGIVWSYGLEMLWFGQMPGHWTAGGVVAILVSLGMVAVDKHQQQQR